ncbi:MAG: hypothetical protein EB070_09850 [Synechococcaceae bacterium WBA_2_066]|nr:hypothetical protein [Synechococcaceae bacterium WBA_2_066]NDG30750.1 hypothetical protein [bacterium]
MSNVTVFQQDLPDFLKNTEVDELTKALAGGAQNRRISIRGGRFRLVINGEEVSKTDRPELDIIIAAGRKENSRVFYAKAYNPKEITPPDCWSDDGITPNAKAENRQASTCADCPQNIAGSGSNGTRACRYQKRLAVVLANDSANGLFQLTLPSQSIFAKGDMDSMGFDQYAKYIAGNGKNINMVITRMSFDEDSDVPVLKFRAVGYVNREQYEAAIEGGKSAEAQRMLSSTIAQIDNVKTLPKAELKPEPKMEEPVKRPSKKLEPTEVADKKRDLSAVLDAWGDDN